MRAVDELLNNEIQILSVDHVVFVPTCAEIRLNFTGMDVIHS